MTMEEAQTFGTQLLSNEDLATLQQKQNAAAISQLVNPTQSKEEPMSPPEGWHEEPVTKEHVDTMLNNLSESSDLTLDDDTETESVLVSPTAHAPEEQTVVISVPEPVAETSTETNINIPEGVSLFSEEPLYEDAPVTQETITDPIPSQPVKTTPDTPKPRVLTSFNELRSIRKPDINFSDSIVGYTENGVEIRSRVAYNPSLIRIHRSFWKNNTTPEEKITIPSRAKIKKNGNIIPYLWDEGGFNSTRNTGFATIITDSNGKKLEPIMAIIPETEFDISHNNAILVNWHHAKMPVSEGYYLLSASTNEDGEYFLTVYQVTNCIYNAENLNEGARFCQATIEAQLVEWFSVLKQGDNNIKSSNTKTLINNPFSDYSGSEDDHPAIHAVLTQCNELNATRPGYCRKFTITYNKDYKLYLNDNKFNDIMEIADSNDDLLYKLNRVTADVFPSLKNGQQVRIYRIAKFYPSSHDITVFYYVVKYNVKEGTYGDDRIASMQITFTPNDSAITLFGDTDRYYTFEELLNNIKEHSNNNQLITELRRVTV